MKAEAKVIKRERNLDGKPAYLSYRVEILTGVLKYYLRIIQTRKYCKGERDSLEAQFYLGAVEALKHIARVLCQLDIITLRECKQDIISIFGGGKLLYKEVLQYEFVEGDLDDEEDEEEEEAD